MLPPGTLDLNVALLGWLLGESRSRIPYLLDLESSRSFRGGSPAAQSSLSVLVWVGRPVMTLVNRLYVGIMLSRILRAPVQHTSEPYVRVGIRRVVVKWCRV